MEETIIVPMKGSRKKILKKIVDKEPESEMIRMIDLFAGTGAFSYAFERTGKFKSVYTNDMEKSSETIYKLNFADCNFVLKDLNTIDVASIPHHTMMTGGFPCFVAGTKVITKKGYCNIEDVCLEDQLLTHTGSFQRILNLQQKEYRGKLYNIRLKYHGETIVCTDEHPFYIREKEKKWNHEKKKYEIIYHEPIWKKASDLNKDDYYGMVINDKEIIPEITVSRRLTSKKSENITVRLDKPEYWFMMGYFIGNGWIEDSNKSDGRSRHNIRFAIHERDLEEVSAILQKVIPVTDKKNYSGKSVKMGCSNEMWYEILKEFGRYAYGKMIPEWLQDSPKEYIQEFINGYMKADGCINREGVYQITTVSYSLAYGLQRLYLKLGHVFSINKCVRPPTHIIQGRIVNQRDTYCVRGKLNKVKESCFIDGNYAWMPAKSIVVEEVNEPISVYNFEVENDNSYIVDNCIVHNCQPFSISGKQLGFEDERSNVFWKILDILREHQTEVVVLENVKNLQSHDNGNTFRIIKGELEKLGYHIKYEILDTCKITPVPQHRERIYIVCFKDKEKYDRFSFDFPQVENRPITDYLEEDIDEKYYYSDKLKVYEEVSQTVTKHVRENVIYQYRRYYVRENKSQCCPTLTANMGGGGHNVPLLLDNRGVRKLTPRECFNLQGFPRDYKLPSISDSSLYKLAGNAVSVPVVELIAQKIQELF